jgi:hypothetical protein
MRHRTFLAATLLPLGSCFARQDLSGLDGDADGGSADGGSADGGSADGGGADGGGADGGGADGGSGDSGDSGGDGGDVGDLRFTGLSPSDGTTAGGTALTVRGGPFDESYRAWLDGVPATVTGQTNETLNLVAPPGAAGPATLLVESTTSGARLEEAEAYTYWQDALGKDVGAVAVEVQGDESGAFAVFAVASFFPATTVDLRDHVNPVFDACGSSYSWPGGDQAFTSLTASGPLSLPLDWDSADGWYTATKTTSLAGEGDAWGLAGTALDWPAISLSSIGTTPSIVYLDFEELSLESDEVGYSLSVKWSGNLDGDFVAIGISDRTQVVSCLTEDDGYFTIPGEDLYPLLEDYYMGRVESVDLELWVSRSTVDEHTVDFNRGTLQVRMAWTYLTGLTVYSSE